MSWEAYIPNILANGVCQKAFIHGQNGVKWAESEGLGITEKEIEELMKRFNDEANNTATYIGGKKFMILRRNESTAGCPAIYFKLKDNGGFCIVKTTNALVAGGFDEGGAAGSCNNVVEGIADYLKGMGC